MAGGVGGGDKAKYSYLAKFSRSPTIEINIKRADDKEVSETLGRRLSFNLTTSQISALHLALGNVLRLINEKDDNPPKMIKVFEKTKGTRVKNKEKISDIELDSVKGGGKIVDLTRNSIYSYEAIICDVSTVITFRLIEGGKRARVTFGKYSLFAEPATFKELNVLFVVMGDFLGKIRAKFLKGLQVFKIISVDEKSKIECYLEAGDDDDDEDVEVISGSENGDDWADGGKTELGNGMVIDVDDDEDESVSDCDGGSQAGCGNLTNKKRKGARIWPLFPGESSVCLSRKNWMDSVEVSDGIFGLIDKIRCNDSEILIKSFNVHIIKKTLVRMVPELWANDELVDWGLRYFASYSTGEGSQSYGQLTVCHPHGQKLTLIFGLFYMAKMLESNFEIETFERWFGGLADRFLAAPKWCMPVNVTETHFFFMVVLVEEMRVEVCDSMRQDASFYEKYFVVAKKTAEAAARYSGKTLSGKWSLTVDQTFPQQFDGHNCAFAMMCGIFDHLTGESISTSREDFVGLRKTLAAVMYREVPEKFK